MGAQESIKRRHRIELGDAHSGQRCQWDNQPWPCDVAILFDRIETLEGAERALRDVAAEVEHVNTRRGSRNGRIRAIVAAALTRPATAAEQEAGE